MNERMVGFIRNDGGRKEAGYKGTTGDCVVRAVAIMSGRGYRECYDACASANKLFSRSPKASKSARNGVSDAAWQYVLTYLGFADTGVKASDEMSITEAYNRYGDSIVEIPRHLIAVKDGYVVDAWDSRFVRRSQRSQGIVHPVVTAVWRHPDHAGPVELPELDDHAKEVLRLVASDYLIKVFENTNGNITELNSWQVSKPNLPAVKRWADTLYFKDCYQLQGMKWHPMPFDAGYFKSGSTITVTIEEVNAECG